MQFKDIFKFCQALAFSGGEIIHLCLDLKPLFIF